MSQSIYVEGKIACTMKKTDKMVLLRHNQMINNKSLSWLLSSVSSKISIKTHMQCYILSTPSDFKMKSCTLVLVFGLDFCRVHSDHRGKKQNYPTATKIEQNVTIIFYPMQKMNKKVSFEIPA